MNKVKLDKSLIDKFFELNNLSAVENIISLAHSLNFQITAEGIEELKQYESLRNIDCDYFQGYYFSKPLEVIEIEKIYFNKQE
jgi:EAL domain-containing protein (putative c-di-GMP-specific phosphodiesterase class I)